MPTASIWAPDPGKEFPSESSLKEFIDFYLHRLRVLIKVLCLSAVLSGIVALALRIPYASVIAFFIALLIAVIVFARSASFPKSLGFLRRTRPPSLVTPPTFPVAASSGPEPHPTVGDVSVIRPSGSLRGEAAIELIKQIDMLLNEGHRRILIDLRNVRAMDAAGIGSLISCFTAVERVGGQIKLLHAMPNLPRLFEYQSYQDELTALEAFRN